MNDSSAIIWTGIFSVLSAIIGGVLVLIGQAFFQRRQDKAVRDQIVFLLRSLSVQMAMFRDYPQYYRLTGYDAQLARLTDKVLSTDGSTALNSNQRTEVLEALAVGEQSGRYIQTDLDKFMSNPPEYREYITAAARRAFAKLEVARRTLGDASSLTKPVDPRDTHNWQPGTPIRPNPT